MSDTPSSKYTIPTGPGYVGVYSAVGHTAYVSVGVGTPVDWDVDTTVAAIDHDDEPGIQLVAGQHPESIVECSIVDEGRGTSIHLFPPALEALDGFEPGEDVRVYDHDAGGLTLVPADDDPFVDGGQP